MKPMRILAAIFCVAVLLLGQAKFGIGILPPSVTVSQLPTASSNTGRIYTVSDGASSTDCTSGSGSTPVTCWSNGTSWTTLGGSGSGTVNSGTSGQLTYYASSSTTVSGNSNANISNGALTLGVATSVIGQLKVAGNTSGTVTITPAAAAGTWTMTLPTTGGTNGYCLTTNGSGTTTWSSCTGGGSGDASSGSIRTETSNYTAQTTDYTILCDASGGAVTVTLYAVSGNSGRILNIKKIDSSANACIVDGNSSETIDGSTTYSITTQYVSVMIQNNGTAWYIL